MRVTMNDVELIQEFVNKVNSTPLEHIEFDFQVSQEEINDWKFTGLSNWYFVLMHGVYK